MTTSELDYPVIVFRKGIAEVRADEDTLTTASSKQMRVHSFDGMTVVDSSGRAVKVKEARFVSGKGRFWGYYSPFLDRIVRTELVFDDSVWNVSLDELKKEIAPILRKEGRAMDSDFVQEEMAKLRESESVRELIERFQSLYDARRFYQTLKKSLADSRD